MQAREALSYPLRGPDRESALVVGFILGFVVLGAIPAGVVGVVVAAVPLVLFVGYLGRIAERSLAGERTIPEITPFGDLLARGSRLSIVVLGYSILPLLYLIGASFVLADISVTGPGTFDGYAFLAVSTSLLIVWGIFWYALPAALITVVGTDSVRSMLAFGRIKSLVGRESYLVTWLQAALLFAFSCSLAGVLIAFDRLAGVIGVPIVVYSAYVSIYLIAGSCADDGALW